MKRLFASDPAYGLYNELWGLFAIAKNPQIFFGEVDLEPAQIQEVLEALEHHMQILLDGFPFEFVEQMVRIQSR
ncbi:MAG: hypothetical protein ACKOC5_18910 [Chloroflexota bacterium]